MKRTRGSKQDAGLESLGSRLGQKSAGQAETGHLKYGGAEMCGDAAAWKPLAKGWLPLYNNNQSAASANPNIATAPPKRDGYNPTVYRQN